MPTLKRTLALTFLIATLFLAYRTTLFYLATRTTIDCPIAAWLSPITLSPITLSPISPTPIQPTDYLQWQSAGFVGSATGAVTERLYADGHLTRNQILSPHCPIQPADKQLQIPPTDATSLIAKARTAGFCRLCRLYRPPNIVYDGGVTELTLHLGNKTYHSTNASGLPPTTFRTIESLEHALPPWPTYTHDFTINNSCPNETQ